MIGIRLAEAGLLPDALVRIGIRHMLRTRLREVAPRDPARRAAATRAFYAECARGPVALVPDLANRQHYEVLPAFYEQVLGRHLKYSCALWSPGTDDLDAAEADMLALTVERARIEDGMRVLDLGCGWGSLSLWIAERFPRARVLAVSNSKPQREFILGRCQDRDIRNLEVVTADINDFSPNEGRRFDRVVSVEMFEHVRNHALLLSRIAGWLEPEGRLFVHHFAHREVAYPYEERSDDDWMARTFFSGGMMPSHDLLRRHPEHLRVEQDWVVNGLHYHRTCEAWLARQDAQRAEILPILADVHGADAAALWYQRWRLFFLGCSELFRYRRGREWWVTHALMRSADAA